MIGRDAIARDLLIVACAVSAGIHAALAPSHLDDGAATAGGFAASAILLALLAGALTRSASTSMLAAASAVLAGLLLSYALAVTSGVPILHPRPEPADGLGLFTKSVELVGLLSATHLLRHRALSPRAALPRLKGILT